MAGGFVFWSLAARWQGAAAGSAGAPASQSQLSHRACITGTKFLMRINHLQAVHVYTSDDDRRLRLRLGPLT